MNVTRSAFLFRVLLLLAVFLSIKVLPVALEFQFGSVFCVGIFSLWFLSPIPFIPSLLYHSPCLSVVFAGDSSEVLSGHISESSYLSSHAGLLLQQLLESRAVIIGGRECLCWPHASVCCFWALSLPRPQALLLFGLLSQALGYVCVLRFRGAEV